MDPFYISSSTVPTTAKLEELKVIVIIINQEYTHTWEKT